MILRPNQVSYHIAVMLAVLYMNVTCDRNIACLVYIFIIYIVLSVNQTDETSAICQIMCKNSDNSECLVVYICNAEVKLYH